jgi:hypothetical protein
MGPAVVAAALAAAAQVVATGHPACSLDGGTLVESSLVEGVGLSGFGQGVRPRPGTIAQLPIWHQHGQAGHRTYCGMYSLTFKEAVEAFLMGGSEEEEQ